MAKKSEQPAATMARNAEAVSAVVGRVGSMDEAIAYALDLCAGKQACEQLLSGCAEPLSDKAADLCPAGTKTLAAPNLAAGDYKKLAGRCRKAGIFPIRKGLRSYLGGVDMALTMAEHGLAATGTLVLDSDSEDVRLATMVSEIHVAVLPVSRILPGAADLKAKAVTKGYTAFITGASRTADIERALTLGVHGPLELHVLLLEEG